MTASMLFILGCMVAAVVWPRKRSGSDSGSCREPRRERGSYLPESPRSRRNRWQLIAHGMREGWESQGSTRSWE